MSWLGNLFSDFTGTISVEETAEGLDLSPEEVETMIEDGEIQSKTILGTTRITDNEARRIAIERMVGW